MNDKKPDIAASQEPKLGEVRQKIDALDAQIQSLISDRARLATLVRQSKGELDSAVDYYRPEREAQVLRAVQERNEGPIDDTEMLRLFREIMSVCLLSDQLRNYLFEIFHNTDLLYL